MVQKALLGLWSKSEIDGASVDLTKPLTYNDRMRFRDKIQYFVIFEGKQTLTVNES